VQFYLHSGDSVSIPKCTCYLGCFLTDSFYITFPAETNITGIITHKIHSLFLKKLGIHINDTKKTEIDCLLLHLAPPV